MFLVERFKGFDKQGQASAKKGCARVGEPFLVGFFGEDGLGVGIGGDGF